MTIKEAIGAATKLIPDDREAEEVEISWSNDGSYNLTVKTSSKKVITLTTEGLKIEPLKEVSNAYENGYMQGKFEGSKTSKWIPVSERLPDKNGEYLVTVRKDSRFAFNGEATVYEDTFCSLCQWDDCGEDVIAWMEMPEPYKENES